MSSFDVSDKLHGHPDVVRILRQERSAALGLWVLCGSWSAGNDTYGFIPDEIVSYFMDGTGHPETLVDAGLFLPTDGGYMLGHGRSNIFDLWRIQRSAKYRRKISSTVRLAVYERDGWACVDCGAVEGLSLDHIHPWSLGGSDDFDNLQTMCRPCNSSKGARV